MLYFPLYFIVYVSYGLFLLISLYVLHYRVVLLIFMVWNVIVLACLLVVLIKTYFKVWFGYHLDVILFQFQIYKVLVCVVLFYVYFCFGTFLRIVPLN